MIPTYEIFYEKISDEDRKNITLDINQILEDSAKHTTEIFKKAIESAVTKMYEQTIVNPWVEWLKDNGNAYDFLDRVKQFIWKQILESNPSKNNQFEMRQLLESWKRNYPEEYHNEINKEYVERAEKAEKQLKEISLRIIKN